MIRTLVIAIFISACCAAAAGQISPTPVINNEVRDAGSIRMRSLEFERIKRDLKKGNPNLTDAELEARFDQIREDFEEIQKLELGIVEAYTTGSRIDFEKIVQHAGGLARRAVRLEANLFGEKLKKETLTDAPERTVRELIIELDGELTAFVREPVFANLKTVDAKAAEEARGVLERIIRISSSLSEAARLGR